MTEAEQWAGKLVLVRHGQSLYNAENRFTGRDNPGLTRLGETQAVAVGRMLKPWV